MFLNTTIQIFTRCARKHTLVAKALAAADDHAHNIMKNNKSIKHALVGVWATDLWGKYHHVIRIKDDVYLNGEKFRL